MNRYFFILVLVFQLINFSSCSHVKPFMGNRSQAVCAVYVSGSGCPNCGAASQVLFHEFVKKYPNLVILEYEIYTDKEYNKPVSDQYFKTYATDGKRGVPFLILNQAHSAIGRSDVLKLGEVIQTLGSNPCPLTEETSGKFEEIDLTKLPGKVRVWSGNRLLMSDGTGGGDNGLLHRLILDKKLQRVLEKGSYEIVQPTPVVISGGQIDFRHAVRLGSWQFQWNGEPDL